LLDQILSESVSKRLTVIFDLDSTLFCVSPRSQFILRELAGDLQLMERYPLGTPHLAQVVVTANDWGIRPALSRGKVVGTIDFFEEIRKRWSERFFSSDYLHLDEPYPGAVDYLSLLEQKGVAIHYLTGRDEPRMRAGTLKALCDWKFPLASAEHLHMKPSSERHDAEFKKDRLERLNLPADVTWFFENEPVIINLVRRALPSIKIVFMDSVHSGREQAPGDLPRIGMSYRLKGPA
jgi:hypothetical protein